MSSRNNNHPSTSANGDVLPLSFLPRSIEETMAEVRRDWGACLREDFNPLLLAFEMLERNNPLHDPDRFLDLNDRLKEAMEFVVEEYHGRFANAVGLFGGVVDNVKGLLYFQYLRIFGFDGKNTG